MDLFLGIDGGGTKTRALLANAAGEQIHYAEAGPSNLNLVDEKDAFAALGTLIDGCLEKAGPTSLTACFGFAGASASEVKDKFEAFLRPYGFAQSLIISDAEIALEGAFFGKPGILLIAGTGSACFGKSTDGASIRTGGWGWLADDGGSAGWMGQRALELAVRQFDGREETSELKNAVFSAFGIEDGVGIVTKLYQPAPPRSKVAELAPLVLDLADEGDPCAIRIRDTALDELEKLVRAAANHLDTTDLQISAIGGLVEKNDHFRRALEMRLFDYIFQDPEASPVEGAVQIAKRLAQ